MFTESTTFQASSPEEETFVKEWANFEKFNPWEFDSPDAPGSGFFMNADFIKRLHQARIDCGVPFIINSGFRTREHNESLGDKASPNSSHLKGLAADIACTNSRHRALIMTALIKNGFTRIGIGNTFIHVDYDTDKPPSVFWLY